MVTGDAKGQTVHVEAPAEDGLPRGGQHTESRANQIEAEDRRGQEGPRLQPGWQPTVKPTEGGAMVEEGLTAPGGD